MKPGDLMSAGEIRLRLGVNRQRVYQLTQRPDWPKPVARLTVGNIWRSKDVEDWIRKHRPHDVQSEAPNPTPGQGPPA